MTDGKVNRRSLVDQVADLLRARIELGEWLTDTRIPTEPELVALCGASRNTVREAVRALTFSGVLETRQGDGTYVRSRVDPTATMRALGKASLREHLELRSLLEVEAARLAALRHSPADLAELQQLLMARGDRAKGEPSLADFIERDLRFHRKIAQMSGNASLAALYEFFAVSIGQHLAYTLQDEAQPEPGHEEHAAVVVAIASGDPARAAEAARQISGPALQQLDQAVQS
ncbi:FadR/GntR family transcriptional regulator [Chitinimonas naiadis]